MGSGAYWAWAAVPAAQRLLPPDTLLVVTCPDFVKARAELGALPLSRLWLDPAMQAVTAKLGQRWQAQMVAPLERQWGVRLPELLDLPEGQVTFALVSASTPPAAPAPPAMVLLLDTGGHRLQLATNLAVFKKRWVEAGKKLAAVKLQGHDFAVFGGAGGILPADVRAALLRRHRFDEAAGGVVPVVPRSAGPEPAAPGPDVYMGQVEALLLIADSARVLEGVLARLAGNELPVLADQAAFARQSGALVQAGRIWGWANAGALLAVPGAAGAAGEVPAEAITANPDNALFLSLHTAQILRALGVGSVEGAAFSYGVSAEGGLFQVRLAARAAGQRGFFDLLGGPVAGEDPPWFVPSTALTFSRWRAKGPKLFAATGQMLDELSPRLSSAWDFLIDTAADAARLKDPDFDLRASLTAGLGEDFTYWERAYAGETARSAGGTRSAYVLGSPDPERLAAALSALAQLLPQPEGDNAPREFLGCKIHSTPLPALPTPESASQGPGTLYYAAGGNHVVLSTDTAMVEEFLRGCEARPKMLAQLPGLARARQAVTVPGATAFGYWNDAERARLGLARLQRDSGALSGWVALLPLPELVAEPLLESLNVSGFLEAALLPPYERLGGYFHYSVYGLSVGSEGVTLKFFSPTPPGLAAPR